jgi:hypothetical protein
LRNKCCQPANDDPFLAQLLDRLLFGPEAFLHSFEDSGFPRKAKVHSLI